MAEALLEGLVIIVAVRVGLAVVTFIFDRLYETICNVYFVVSLFMFVNNFVIAFPFHYSHFNKRLKRDVYVFIYFGVN